ncbi:phosphate/phosphite/phosphonate ABC transporter substrate-binding protein [Lactobacillus mulieris]|uniref:phosphate/phosphite/phosphonate ABC transporter substrate-binding protein n=1 Tax=Lactobacillus mulieris TaxID=2508708 RepID=UPI00065DC7DC|nr:phosphate/phosphite/phosphonate ABC transporter substrate-binding protein [Lactobacillus mulieris]MCF1783705.1 phosphate/phosphite/phosphonate ABC transporter substrate-binding protein [Lactobacillus mulieris]MCW8104440.1 phosphate/phosphite/phosphonate ABC transporter substrate-binding protein [Lactobacillus mulieris]MDK6803943.1 phosphate/phosphite/phosphonate ABC transporter substrate-binding protein [Lactobacillus mulieris]MDK8382615.1 phosphate/phosphite/phosphonate ABC transporter subs
MNFKKTIIALVTIVIAVLMGACSTTKSNNATNYTPKELNVQFVPSVQGSKLQDRVKPLEKLLKKQLGIPVHVSVSTSNTALVEAMSSKKVDVGFIGGDTYVLAHKKKAADVLLRAMNEGYDEPSGKPNNKKMSHYRSMIVVKKGSKIKTWKDLKGKKIAVQSPSSTSGYVAPVGELYEKGLSIPKQTRMVQVQGHDQAILSVYNGDVDAACVFADARNIAAKDEPKVMTDTKPIYFTKWLPNDTISVRSDMSKTFRKKLSAAFKNIIKTKEGKNVLYNIYNHLGYVDAKDSDFDIVRKYQKDANKANE